jgi:hypothetical protein
MEGFTTGRLRSRVEAWPFASALGQEVGGSYMRRLLGLLVGALVMMGCGDDPPQSPGRFGEVTSAVVVINPVINQGSSTSLLLAGLAAVLLWPQGQDEAPVSSAPAMPAEPSSAPKQPPASSPKEAASAELQRVPPEQLPNIEQIERWVREGRRDPALRALAQLRAQRPSSAYAPYLEGQVNFDNLRWVDGLASYDAAIRNNPAYRSDPMLIRDLIECLVSDRFHDKCADFLVREVGAPSAPLLEETARTHGRRSPSALRGTSWSASQHPRGISSVCPRVRGYRTGCCWAATAMAPSGRRGFGGPCSRPEAKRALRAPAACLVSTPSSGWRGPS